jgi:hypothetical protein
MKKIVLLSLSMMSLLLLLGVAAQTPEVERKGACREDVDKFCKGIKPGGGRIWACLKSHEAELSQACTDQIAAATKKMKDFTKACRPDAQKFCKGVRPGKGRIISCLKSHESELSDSCKAFF